jgi:peroxiredoxin
MKKSFYILNLLILIQIVACSNDNSQGISLKGKIENAVSGQLVVINKYTEEGVKPIDTVEVSENGSFKTKIPVTTPTFYNINFYNQRAANFILDGTEKVVEIEVDMASPEVQTKIIGSTQTEYLKVYDNLIKNMKEDQQTINAQGEVAKRNGDEAELAALTDEYYTLLENFYGKLKAYSNTIKPSLAVFYGISSLNPNDHFEFYDSLATFYNEKLPDHMFTKDLVKRVESIRGLVVGAKAPEISLPSPTGEIITLSSLQGKYVLIDFWAAWCKPCRMENPNVVRMYNQYKDKNFEILGVSLDREKSDWVNAIANDGLVWKHVSDLKYFNSEAAAEYKISSIPATYLVDPQGKIIAKNLRGPSLEQKLSELFD